MARDHLASLAGVAATALHTHVQLKSRYFQVGCYCYRRLMEGLYTV